MNIRDVTYLGTRVPGHPPLLPTPIMHGGIATHCLEHPTHTGTHTHNTRTHTHTR